MKRLLIVIVSVLLLAVIAGVALWRFDKHRRSFYTDGSNIQQAVGEAFVRDVLWQPPVELAGAINSNMDECEAHVSLDGSTLVLARRNANGQADLFIAQRDSGGGWSEPQPLFEINTDADERSPALSPDGRTLVLASDRSGGIGGYDLWLSKRGEFGWGEPVNLGPQINSECDERGPAVSPDNSLLLFASNRPSDGDEASPRQPNDLGDDDLYSAMIVPDGFGEAIALVALNTPRHEAAPAISPAGDFLYFCSNREGGAGGFDLYRSRRLDGRLLAPEPLGGEINTAANEMDPSLEMGGFALVFSSDRARGGGSDGTGPGAGQARATRDSDLWRSESREVFVRVGPREPINWAALWAILAPLLLWLLLLLAGVGLVATMWKGVRSRRLSLLTRCVLASLLAHLVLMILMSFWQVTTQIAQLIEHGGATRIHLTSAGTGSGGLAGQIRGGMTDVGGLEARETEGASKIEREFGAEGPEAQIVQMPGDRADLPADQQGRIDAQSPEAEAAFRERPASDLLTMAVAPQMSKADVAAPADEMRDASREASASDPQGDAQQIARSAQPSAAMERISASNVAVATGVATLESPQPSPVNPAETTDSSVLPVAPMAVAARPETSAIEPASPDIDVVRPGQGADAAVAPRVAEAGAAAPRASEAAASTARAAAADSMPSGMQGIGAVSIMPRAAETDEQRATTGGVSAAGALSAAPEAQPRGGSAAVPASSAQALAASAQGATDAALSLPADAAARGGDLNETVAAVSASTAGSGTASRSAQSTVVGVGAVASPLTQLPPGAAAAGEAVIAEPLARAGELTVTDSSGAAAGNAGPASMQPSVADALADRGSAPGDVALSVPAEIGGALAGGGAATQPSLGSPGSALASLSARREAGSTSAEGSGGTASSTVAFAPGAASGTGLADQPLQGLAARGSASSAESGDPIGWQPAGDGPASNRALADGLAASTQAGSDIALPTDTGRAGNVLAGGEGDGSGLMPRAAAASSTRAEGGSGSGDGAAASPRMLESQPGIAGNAGAADGSSINIATQGISDANATDAARASQGPASDRSLHDGLSGNALAAGGIALPGEMGGAGDAELREEGAGTGGPRAAAALSSRSRGGSGHGAGAKAGSGVLRADPGAALAAGAANGGVNVSTQAVNDASTAGAAQSSQGPASGSALGEDLPRTAVAMSDIALPGEGAGGAASNNNASGERGGGGGGSVMLTAAGPSGSRAGSTTATSGDSSPSGAAVRMDAEPANSAGAPDGSGVTLSSESIPESTGAGDGVGLDSPLPAMALGDMNLPGSPENDIDIRIPTETAPPNNPYAARPEAHRIETVKRMGGSEETERAVAMALEWLARHQSPDGRWATRTFDEDCGGCFGEGKFDTDIATTGLALLCFLGADHTHLKEGRYQQNVVRGLKWLLDQQKPDGDLRGDETMYSHGIASITLGEALGMTNDRQLAEPVRRAVEFIEKARNRNVGGWRYEPGQSGDTSVAGWQLMALMSAKRAGIPTPDGSFAAAGAWLETVSFPDQPGRYAYQPGQPWSVSMSAESMFMQQLLGVPRDDRRQIGSAAYVLENLPKWEIEPNTYYWYYATLAMFQHQGTAWETWNAAITETLLKNQRQSGAAAGSWDPRDNWSKIGGRVYQTAICTLCLEVYYRYLPMYQAPLLAEAQSAVSGTVTDARSGTPLANAVVRLDMSSTSGALTAVTDLAGRYALALPALPADFVALSASREGYTPSTTNIAAAEANNAQVTRDFALVPEQSNVIAIETDPKVHHLGNNEFEGAINSQFQNRAEGLTWEAEFTLGPEHLPPAIARAHVQLMVKGAQAQNPILINDRRLPERMNRAPSDGSFGEFRVEIPLDLLVEGVNTIIIRSSNSEVDHDDYEFVNVQVHLE